MLLVAKRDSHGPLDPGDIRRACDRVDRNAMKFDLQVRRSFVECCVGGCGNNLEKEIKRPRYRPESWAVLYVL